MARRAGGTCSICEAVSQPAICASCTQLRLAEKYKLLRRLKQEREVWKQRLETAIRAKRDSDIRKNWIVEHSERVAKKSSFLHRCEKDLIQGKTRHDEKRKQLEERTERLSAASAQLSARKAELLGHYYPDLVRTQTLNCAAVASEVNQLRRGVFRHLCKLFPLQYSQGDSVDGKPKPLGRHVRICEASLPLKDEPHSVSSTELSASLGYMIHLASLAARYLSAPLLHQAAFAASSSRIWQRNSYWDSNPPARGQELPLFLPRKSSRAIENSSMKLDRQGGLVAESDFTPLERIGSMTRSGSFDNLQNDADRDVKQGLMLLKRSISCICAYGFRMLSLDAPSTMSTFEAFMELLSILSSKENKRRPMIQQLVASRADGSVMQSCFASHLQDSEQQQRQQSSRMNGGAMSDFFYVVQDNNKAVLDSSLVAGAAEEWDVIDHPLLPPPSQSEDVEHWTRAMILDATK